ncbi:MAG: SsrA-binding protein [Candidatus Brennerbacteria bacterium CG23_combo_of_CG06-09_8_20_14_all_44_41]|uniref:SsrA-binding protein n=3 Tax=Candidatus Brenneribacteriota TaxID=1817902 RepID=A0A2H9N4M1_9BACT|nr:MAG: SsrA-binding protein [Parcubacteria group bacterium CG1_02_44_31]PIP50324.1 MAG: SsrA-binding protein [Candidatus Brennerbacteria bacterium CG23_combo_of_CG06-09_8_20_14_all_44_41]PIX28817.1 MAG: SsrA-binding protein [Candidatus Brennerbacteria bacterium CG_4_8_14_3_um_filter_43_14]PJA19515.1 MAG: SsrA-binding protein [Candidatus Brennerbacteria bacterium CG_4_10_14_0_2_um_filter_43_14]
MAVYAQNRKARFDYDILETFQTGIVLYGFEVKSVRAGRVDLKDSYITVKNNELWLLNAKIYPLQPKNIPATYRENRSRKILAHADEVKRMIGKIREARLTIVPLQMYNVKRYLKLECGLAKSKRAFEKRERIKKRDTEREIERSLKN